ncbi:UNVERIFIED_CONTAM: hypothetical protein Sangu_0395000 [Sesamum angustifolium]|uniref:Reverse transcriptase n=1 Tax=Sesamum angustifolium TaxID=2727405 RepID=A0AAW2QSC1_9LAMI
MAHFLHGLNRDIAGVMEMQHYVELEEMVLPATKVEQQLKRRGLVRRTSNSSTFSPQKNNPRKMPLLPQNSRRQILISVTKLLSKSKLNRRRAKWIEFIESFSFVIKHKKGKENIVADELQEGSYETSWMQRTIVPYREVKFLSPFGKFCRASLELNCFSLLLAILKPMGKARWSIRHTLNIVANNYEKLEELGRVSTAC